MVSWLAKFNPIAMIFTSLLIIFMDRGASEISTVFELNQSFADILTGIILFFRVEFYSNVIYNIPKAVIFQDFCTKKALTNNIFAGKSLILVFVRIYCCSIACLSIIFHIKVRIIFYPEVTL